MRYLSFRGLQAKLDDPGRTTIYRWVQQGILPTPIKIGGKNFWIDERVDEKLAEQAE